MRQATATTLPQRHAASLAQRQARRLGRRLLAAAVLGGWVLMPLMPLLALAFTWFSSRS